MNQILTLLKPRLWSFKNRNHNGRDPKKSFLLAGVGLLFWAGIFAVSYRVLIYFRNVEEIGDILAAKLLSMILLVFFSLLVFSSILTSLSKLYLSKDLALVHALPVPCKKIFFARWVESTIDSSWMVIVYTIPVLLAYAVAYDSDFFFYVDIILALFPLCIIASALSALLVMLAVNILPASRIRSIFVFLGLVVLIIFYVTFRMLKPERLVDPEAFATVLLYIQTLSMPDSPLLPNTWAFDSLREALAGNAKSALFHTALSFSCAAFLVFATVEVAGIIYFRGFSKTQAALIRLFQTRSKGLDTLFSFLAGPARAFVIKEIKTFWRDQTQWSQIFLIGALIAIYLYNFSVLPLEKSPIKTVYLQNLFSFLNMALAAFVLTSVTARFAFPSVSIEGKAFWISRSGPISIQTFLWIKFFVYVFPLLILAEILIVASNLLLNVTTFMMYLSSITVFFMTPGVVSLGIGLGAAYPDFTSENPAQSVTSFGGLVFMIISAVFIGTITILQAGPVYAIFMADINGYKLSRLQWLWIVGSFFITFVLSILALIVPMQFGARRLSTADSYKAAASETGKECNNRGSRIHSR